MSENFGKCPLVVPHRGCHILVYVHNLASDHTIPQAPIFNLYRFLVHAIDAVHWKYMTSLYRNTKLLRVNAKLIGNSSP
jgi:hypothetical protein